MKPKHQSRMHSPQSPDPRDLPPKPGQRPLYRSHAAPEARPVDAHAGLWFDKFCNQWCRDPKKDGLSDWTLAAFSTGHGKQRKDVNPKLEWIKTVTNQPVGNAQLLAEYTARLADLVQGLGGQAPVFRTTSRFATGLGREHPIENGFVWHPTLGVPYLPGSSVKGLVRNWLEGGWCEHPVEPGKFRRVFGSDYRKGSSQDDCERCFPNQVGSVLFLEALPVSPVQLKADVMTPHYGDYYQGKSPPADWLSPNPIPFLTVAPGQLFQFALAPVAPGAKEDCDTALQWLTAALKWLGAGAKTAVGYGRFARDAQAEAKLAEVRRVERDKAEGARREAAQKAAREAQLAKLSPLAREFEQAAAQGKWDTDKSAFAGPGIIEGWLDRLEKDPQPDALRRLCELVERHFPGLLVNPDKTEGKKNKPAFKERQRNIAKRLITLVKP